MKLDELKKLVADAFESATDKTIIEKAAVINSKIEEVEAEQKELTDQNADLLKSYRDVVLHTNVKTDPTKNPGDITTGNEPSFEDMLEKFQEEHKAK